jgi:hypothetical protein
MQAIYGDQSVVVGTGRRWVGRLKMENWSKQIWLTKHERRI